LTRPIAVTSIRRSALSSTLPRELGVVLRFEGGEELIPAHHIHRGIDDFAVIRRNQMQSSLLPYLHELTLNELPDSSAETSSLSREGPPSWKKDPRYADPALASLLGRQIDEIRVLKRDDSDPDTLGAPNEAGMVLRFKGGGELILAYGLHDDSDDFVRALRDQLLSRLALIQPFKSRRPLRFNCTR
jgi:hypothetical protein